MLKNKLVNFILILLSIIFVTSCASKTVQKSRINVEFQCAPSSTDVTKTVCGADVQPIKQISKESMFDTKILKTVLLDITDNNSSDILWDIVETNGSEINYATNSQLSASGIDMQCSSEQCSKSTNPTGFIAAPGDEITISAKGSITGDEITFNVNFKETFRIPESLSKPEIGTITVDTNDKTIADIQLNNNPKYPEDTKFKIKREDGTFIDENLIEYEYATGVVNFVDPQGGGTEQEYTIYAQDKDGNGSEGQHLMLP